MNKVSISTLCTSKAEFISKFRPFLDETTIFFASKLPLVIGQRVAFAVCLKDKQPMLEGDGKVIEVQPLPGRSGRSGLRIEVRAFTSASLPTREAILSNRGARPTAPPSRPAPPAPPPAALARPSVPAPAPEPAPLPEPEAPPAAQHPRASGNVLPLVPAGERRRGAPDTLPANPFTDVSTEALSFYIDSNLVESDQIHQVDVLSRDDAGLDSPAIHRNLLVRVLSWRAPSTLPPMVRIGIPMAASSLLTLVACWALWGRAPSEIPPRAPVAAAAPAPTLPAVAAPAPVAAATATAPPVATAPEPPLVSPGTSGCRARIVSRPAGATVTLGKRRLGKTPLQAAAVPCGKQVVTISHPRYRSVEEVIALSPGTAGSSVVRLARPPARLTLTSVPPGATFKVNRIPLGRAPGQASVLRFERARIEARLPGHRPWRETIYVAAPVTKVNAAMVPLASRSPRAKVR